MKKNKQKLAKGMPSAVLLSVLIHAALFLLAGMLVIFTVVKVKEPEFEAPKAVERPKMKLKKPKVKIKKSSKPKSTTRIVTKNNRASMPDIELPEMSGLGDGLGGGVGGGFDLMPDLNTVTLMGSGQSIGNDLVGTFYDFKRDRNNRNITCSLGKCRDILRAFMKDDFRISRLSRYYQSPKKLYATTFVIPTTLSEIAPEAFGETETEGNYWMAHYKGQLVHKDGITFRFLGSGDDLLMVRVDGEIVFGSTWHRAEPIVLGDIWNSSAADSKKYWVGNQKANIGDWITLEPGVPLDMEVILSDNGTKTCLMLGVQEKGVEYEMRTVGGPIFPIFKTSELSLDMQDAIYKDMVAGELCLTNGPVFSDYETSGPISYPVRKERPAASPDRTIDDSEPRIWTTGEGKTREAEYVTKVGGKVILKDSNGKKIRMLLEQLSPEDQEFIELANPPEISASISHTASPKRSIKDGERIGATVGYTYTFTGKVKQTSMSAYNHELQVEYFAIGKEIHGNKYVLLDRQKSYFTPNKENERSLRFSGPLVDAPAFIIFEINRGVKYSDFIIVVTDSRGKIIKYNASAKWLYENLGDLRELRAGWFMDETCTRVAPTGPKRTQY